MIKLPDPQEMAAVAKENLKALIFQKAKGFIESDVVENIEEAVTAGKLETTVDARGLDNQVADKVVELLKDAGYKAKYDVSAADRYTYEFIEVSWG